MCIFSDGLYNNIKGGKPMDIKVTTEENEKFTVERKDLYRIINKYQYKEEFTLNNNFIKCYQFRDVVRRLLRGKDKELAFVIMTMFDYLAQYTNRLECYGEPYCYKHLMQDCGVSQSVAYTYLRKLTDLWIISRVKVDGKMWYYMNPLYFQRSARCKTETLRYFQGGTGK